MDLLKISGIECYDVQGGAREWQNWLRTILAGDGDSCLGQG